MSDPQTVPEPGPRPVPLARLPRRRRLRFSAIWLVPVAALLVTVWLAARALIDRGSTIEIVFATAEGLEVRRTPIKYRSVDVGTITGIDLLDDRSGVVVTAEISRKAEPMLVEDARFWVVRPRISPAGVSGIGTLLAGVHIGVEPGRSTARRTRFDGLESPPLVTAGRPGRRFRLRADDIGSLEVGSPLYLRRFQVGQVVSVGLEPGGGGALLDVFVQAPHDRQVSSGTRFWNASGLDVTLDARGLKLDTQSLVSVVAGGIAFQETGTPAGSPAPEGTEFRLFPGRDAALRQLGSAPEAFTLVFPRAVRGLDRGAPVEVLGLDLGEVSDLRVDFDARSAQPRTVVEVQLYLDLLHVRDAGSETTPAAAGRELLGRLVARGLRARVDSPSIFSPRRLIALDLVPGAAPARLDFSRRPYLLPTSTEEAQDLPGAVNRLVAKLQDLPLEGIAREGTLAVQDLRRLVTTAEKGFEKTFSREAPLQNDLRNAMRDLSGAGVALRSLAEYLERHPEALVRGKRGDRP